MSGDMLSQEEIDALLNGGQSTSEEPTKTEDVVHSVEDYLDEVQRDAIGELGNISFGSSATALSTLLNQKVEITTPSVSIIDHAKLEEEFPHPCAAIRVKYTEGFSGVNILVIKQSDATIIADLMLGGDGTNPSEEMDEIHLSAIQEAMNQMMGSAATSMSSVFNKRVDISPPTVDLMNISEGEGTSNIPQNNLLVKVAFQLKIGTLIDSEIMQVLPIEFARNLVRDLLAGGEEADQKLQNDDPQQLTTNNSEVVENNSKHTDTESDHSNQALDTKETLYASHSHVQPNVQPATFADFNEMETPSYETKNLDMLLDIPLQVTVELGRTNRSVKDILELGAGSVIELDKLAGEPVDILVNSRLIAKGEVVVIDENFGVRVTDIVSQSDRLKKLN
ncbi:flagellar motor switch phosphatase FliY [Bacillus sp. J14TS2]|uniref:flagellar motor switch phosphatase FliY n=1 Tax=Bacillus sp. J14TS2 TaxID=2807188 RepID=UPI001B1A0367|nr:flagellar motor switch phosphatase FliY [Bacillus sp. J14TS2]GIN70465.1 flagellar motor switch phosphatase FliY [Bacillus sp. J14TS2]